MNTRLIFCLISLTLPVLAQTGAGRIQGTVRDITGAIIPNAKVSAVQIETGSSFDTVSNNMGYFLFPSVQPGRYRLTAESAGLEKWQGELLLQSGQDAVVDPVLKVGGTTTEITVAGDVTPVVTTTSPTLSNVVERARIEELPLQGRFIQDLIMLTTPGLEGAAGNPKAYGLRDQLVQFVQDGASITDANIGQISYRPPGLDTIQEARVDISVPSAKYSAPVTTVLSTRSGTNQAHGGLFYTGRNSGFGVARRRQEFWDKPPQLIRNEYGASLGGPVVLPKLYNGKDRTFFFFSWEAFRLRNKPTMGAPLPTMAMRNGDFSQLTDGAGLPVTLYDPWSTGSRAQNYSRVPFVGNVIPLNRRSPFAAYFNGVMPEPNRPNNPSMASNWFGANPTYRDDSTYTLRIDQRIGQKDQIYGRYTIGDGLDQHRRPNNTSPITLDKLWNSEDVGESMQTGSFSWNHTFGPAFFVETIVTGARMNWKFSLHQPGASQILLSNFGLPNPFDVRGAPRINNIGFGFEGYGATPRSQDTRPITAEQNYMAVRGKHQWEFGWRYKRTMLDVLPDRPPAAAIAFNSQATGLYNPASGTAYAAMPRTGHEYANFFIGVAAYYNQTLPSPEQIMRSNAVSGFLQDNWKVSSHLTLNLGLRYEFMQPLLDARGINAVFDVDRRAIVRKASEEDLIRLGGTTRAFIDSYKRIGVKFVTTKEAGISDNLVNVGQRNFEPRVGFAYNWKLGHRSMVLRGGYGEYRFSLGARLYVLQRANPPLEGMVSYNTNNAAQSPDGFANYGLRSVPTVIAGTDSAVKALTREAVNAIPRGVAVRAFAHDLPIPKAREWNLTLETEIMRNTLLRVAYVGTAGRNLEQRVQMNGQASAYVWYATTGEPLPTGEFAPVVRRSYDRTTYGDIFIYQMSGYSNFNGAQVELQRRYSNGLGFQWFYVMSNALWMGSGTQTVENSSTVLDPVTYLPGSVPSNFDAYNRFLNYSRDSSVPKHRMNWNVLYDLPFGRGKKWLANSGGLLNRIVGGWEIASYATMRSRYWALPTENWGYLGNIEIYGKQYPVEDCRSGECIRGYLYYNGYIPANLINSYDAQGRPNGVMGVPANYQPAHKPIHPIPANPNRSDPNFPLYNTNNVFVPMKSGALQQVAYDTGLHPWRQQYIPGPWNWVVNSSVFKVIPLTEHFKLRLNVDAFNVLNRPGTPLPAAGTGILSLRNSDNEPRVLQWSLRLNW